MLIAEDDIDLCDVLRMWLAPRFEVLTAHDGDTALTLAHRFPPDVVILDVMMPRLSGHGLLWALERHPVLSRARAIVITAHDHAALALPAQASVLHKPFERDALEALLADVEPLRPTHHPSERRRAERASLDVPATLEAGKEIGGRLLSLSLIGGFFEPAAGAPAVDTEEVRLRVTLSGAGLVIPARIVHSGTAQTPGLGLAFHDMGLAAERHLLRTLVALLEGREP